jgi:transposase-like protein
MFWSNDDVSTKRLLRKLLKRQRRPPRVIIIDKLASYGAARREVVPGIEPALVDRQGCDLRPSNPDFSRGRKI